MGVYCPPSSVATQAAKIITEQIDQLERKHPHAAIMVLGDFNHIELKLKAYEQMVTCSTRADRTLDKCYCNIRNAYVSKKLPPLGMSDHDLIQLMPTCVQRFKRIKPAITQRKIWSSEACEALQCAFETTDWSVILNESDSLEPQTTILTDYINYCVDQYVPKKFYVQYPNSKP